ncbi:MAG: hypothetical protein GNW80_01675 [Asgard group archaeon]|nr:hypothetical protein [Asgard group archaeon]
MSDMIICGDYIVTMDKHIKRIKNGAIYIVDNKVADVDLKKKILKDYSSKNSRDMFKSRIQSNI